MMEEEEKESEEVDGPEHLGQMTTNDLIPHPDNLDAVAAVQQQSCSSSCAAAAAAVQPRPAGGGRSCDRRVTSCQCVAAVSVNMNKSAIIHAHSQCF